MKKPLVGEIHIREKKKIEETEKSYQKMWEEIKPFIKKRKFKQYSTRGEWKISNHRH